MTWHARSACLGSDAELFFPERGDNAGVDAALAVCAECEVVEQCLAENLEARDGIYGGTTGAERREMRRNRSRIRSCIWCGSQFEGRAGAGFCSTNCQKNRRRQQQRDSAQRVGPGL